MKQVGKDPNSYGIIGLGRFGTTVALELAKAGKDVVVLENDVSKIAEIKGQIDHIFPVETITQEVLVESGIAHCATVIVCIGSNIESSILVTLNVIELGVPRVIAKANSEDHGKVLRKIGAEVVFPEVESGIRLAKSLVSMNTLEFLELDDDTSISTLKLSPSFDGRTLQDLNFRKKFHLNIIAIIREHKTNVAVDPTTTQHEDDELVVIGRNDDIARFEKLNIKE